jgi:hypothetical protein
MTPDEIKHLAVLGWWNTLEWWSDRNSSRRNDQVNEDWDEMISDLVTFDGNITETPPDWLRIGVLELARRQRGLPDTDIALEMLRERLTNPDREDPTP